MTYQKIELEGNHGGDIFGLTITDDTYKNGTVELKVGHCCVYTIEATVPVEFLTAVLSTAVTIAGGIESVIRELGWPEQFTNELLAKVEMTGVHYDADMMKDDDVSQEVDDDQD